MKLFKSLRLHEPIIVHGQPVLLGDALIDRSNNTVSENENKLMGNIFYYLALFGACSRLTKDNQERNEDIKRGWKLSPLSFRELRRLNEEDRIYSRQPRGPFDRELQKVMRYLARQRELCNDLKRYFDKPELIALYMYINGMNSLDDDEFEQLFRMGKLELCTEIEQTLSNIINRQTNPPLYHRKQEEQESPMKRLKK